MCLSVGAQGDLPEVLTTRLLAAPHFNRSLDTHHGKLLARKGLHSPNPQDSLIHPVMIG
jgi:hypothetical protein